MIEQRAINVSMMLIEEFLRASTGCKAIHKDNYLYLYLHICYNVMI